MRFIAYFSFIAFFLSGFSALIYELTWVRLLKNIFGSDSLALSTLLTVFIGGIALGTFIAGKLIEKYIKITYNEDEELNLSINIGQAYLLLYSYGFIELLIGLYALFVPFLLDESILGKLWQNIMALGFLSSELALGENIVIITLIKFVISTLVLILPTLLLGMGFPILSELLVSHQRDEHDQLATSNLYATNTLGAILGALCCGFYLLPNIGLDKSVYLASAINFFIAILVFLAFKLNKEVFNNAKFLEVFNFIKEFNRKKSSSDDHKNAGLQQYNKVFLSLILIGSILGYVNLSLEVVWSKILTLVIGSSNYSLTIILAVVLAGISFGAYFLNYFIRICESIKLDYLSSLKYGLVAFAISIVISSSLFNQLPWIFLKLSNLVDEFIEIFSLNIDLSWLLLNLSKFFLVALIIFPVTFIEGLLFAFILFMISGETNMIDSQDMDPVGVRVAKASSFNTLGAIIGSFSTGFILIPLFSKYASGIYNMVQFIIVLSFSTIIIPFYLGRKESKKDNFYWSLAFIILLMLISIFNLPSLKAQELASGAAIYQGRKFKKIDKKDYKKAIGQKILFHKEGLNNIVTVEENTAVNAIFLKNNGKIEAGMPLDPSEPSKADMLTQVFLGSLPVLVKPDAQKALMIGMGSGISLKSLAQVGKYTSLKEIEVCEIEDLVYQAADEFFVKDYPADVKINRYTVDARNHLSALKNNADKAKFDIIISQPSDPWISGSLFTYEFWDLAAQNLNDEGVFLQWLQLYSIDPEYLTIALRTFKQVFPETLVFKSGNAAELLLLGSKSKIDINSLTIAKLIEEGEIKDLLSYIGIEDDADLFANLVLVPNAVEALVNENLEKIRSLVSISKIKVLKFISKIPESGIHRPKLGSENLNREKYFKEIDKFKGRISTDDNMILEFHTSKKISNFTESIKANESLLVNYAKADHLLNYFAQNPDKSFISRLSSAHNKLVRESQVYKIIYPSDEKEAPYLENVYDKSLHGNIAQGLATSLKDIYDSPAVYLNLFEINLRRDELEIADSIIADASSKFSDIFASNKKKLIIFEGLVTNVELDSYQLYSLAALYVYNENFSKARKIINQAIEKLDQEAVDNKIKKNRLAKIYALEAKTYFREFESKMNSTEATKKKTLKAARKLSIKAFTAFDKALSLDPFSTEVLLGIAEFELFKAEKFPNEASKLKLAAVKHLKQVISINPNTWQAHLLLAMLHKNKLPQSQIKIMELMNNKISDKDLQQNLEASIRYLKNTLSLNPLSINANYEMADIQYRLGNLDLSFMHLKRLRKLCMAETLCLDQLGDSKLENAKTLYKKLNGLILTE